MKRELTLNINGQTHCLQTPQSRLLVDVLRDDLRLIGTKEGCGSGVCGACTVLLDGVPVSSCILLVAFAEGKAITTIEGLAGADGLHPVQEAFIEADGFQCGYCTSGLILTTVALLQENGVPTLEETKAFLAGSLCRCTSYEEILTAVQLASQRLRSPHGAAAPTAGGRK